MRPLDQFANHDVAEHLRDIVHTVKAVGAEVDFCGENKITIRWADGETVHVRRFRGGTFRWLVFTAVKYRALLLADRDPSLRELQTVRQDPLAP